jgi:hypothetical protein
VNYWSFPILAAVALTAAPACAESQLKAAPAALNPNQGYALVRLGERNSGVWNFVTLAPYDEKAQDVRGQGRAKANPVPPKTDRSVSISPKPFLDETDHVRTYLVAMSPGLYVVSASPTTCFCMGSYSVYVAPGKITDLGFIYVSPENGSSPWGALSNLRSAADLEERGYTVADAMAIVPAAAETAVPASLAALPREAAAYRPAPRLSNYRGLLINRALPLEPAK